MRTSIKRLRRASILVATTLAASCAGVLIATAPPAQPTPTPTIQEPSTYSDSDRPTLDNGGGLGGSTALLPAPSTNPCPYELAIQRICEF